MRMLLKVNDKLWINPAALLFAEKLNATVHLNLNGAVQPVTFDEWAAIEPLVTFPTRAAGCSSPIQSVTAKAIEEILIDEEKEKLLAEYRAKQEVWHADLLAEDQARVYTPDEEKPSDDDFEDDEEAAGPLDTDLARLRTAVERGDFVILDTETTSKYPQFAELCQIAIIDANGNTLLDTLVNPGISIPNSFIHGITDEMVFNAPKFEDIAPKVYDLLENRAVIIYNEGYDEPIIRRLLEQAGLSSPVASTHCAMLAYAEYRGVWNDYHGNWKWYKLTDASDRVGYKLPAGMKAHSALADCLMTLAVCRKLASV